MKLPEAWLEHDRKIRPYQWSHRILSITQSLIGLGLLVQFTISARLVHLEGYLESYTGNPFLLWILYFGSLVAAWEVISLPFAISHHWIERSHGLSKQTYVSWMIDRLKGYGVGAVLGSLTLGILYFSVTTTPDYWWLLTAVLFIFLSVVLAQLAPILLIPLFFKMKPMEPSALKERLLSLAARFEIKVKDVYHLGLGEKTEKGNAAFLGLGKTKRIVIGDTLYEKYAPEEVEAVFAHELGHQVHDDLWKGLILSSVLLVLGFWITFEICQEWLWPGFETGPLRPFGMLVFFVTLSIVQKPGGQLQRLFSRWRERMADGFAAGLPGQKKPLGDALEKLTYQNRGSFKPNAIYEFFTYSHPAPWRRIMKLQA